MAAHIAVRKEKKSQKQQKVHKPVVQRARNVQLTAAVLIPQQSNRSKAGHVSLFTAQQYKVEHVNAHMKT